VSYTRSLIAALTVFLLSALVHAGDAERNPTAADCNNRGVDLCAQEQYEKALREFNKALRLNPWYGLAYKNRAILFLRYGAAMPGRSRPYFRQALADYSAALQLDPKDADAYRERGLVHARMGDADKAIADFTQAIKIKPDFAEAYRGRSKAYRDNGDIDRAVADVERAIKLQAR